MGGGDCQSMGICLFFIMKYVGKVAEFPTFHEGDNDNDDDVRNVPQTSQPLLSKLHFPSPIRGGL